MDKRGQSALEYLMTYGWALIVIAIVIGVLIYVTSSSTGGVTCQSQSTALVLKEWAVVAGLDGAGITLQNATGGTIDAANISAVGSGSFAPTDSPDDTAITPATGNLTVGNTFTVTLVDVVAAGNSFSDGIITVTYETAGGLTGSGTIVCAGTV